MIVRSHQKVCLLFNGVIHNIFQVCNPTFSPTFDCFISCYFTIIVMLRVLDPIVCVPIQPINTNPQCFCCLSKYQFIMISIMYFWFTILIC